MIPLLLYELVLYSAIQAFGLLVGYRLSRSVVFSQQVVQFTPLDFVAAFLIATAFFFIFLKFLKRATFFKILFLFLIVAGSKVAFSAFFNNAISSILTVGVVLLWVALPYVTVHNFVILMTISGISASIGLGLRPGMVIIILAVLSLYDVIAVYKTKHMVTMFNKLLEKGVIMSIVVPKTQAARKGKVKDVRPGGGFMLLGTGDIAFPLIFAISALSISFKASIFIILGSLVGVAVVNQLLVSQSERRAIPALPPIALFSILGFFASILF